MKEMVMMTREEYKAFYESFQNLKTKCDLMDVDLSYAQDRINRLWNELNRPAIEALQAKHDAEFYDWCDEMAEKYNRLEEEEWLTDRAKFYNNGIYDFCQEEGISEKEAYAHRQYYMDKRNIELKVAKTEGWSDLLSHSNGFHFEYCLLQGMMYGTDIKRTKTKLVYAEGRTGIFGNFHEHGTPKVNVWVAVHLSFTDNFKPGVNNPGFLFFHGRLAEQSPVLRGEVNAMGQSITGLSPTTR